MRIHFTELAVKQLKPSSAAYWDALTPGFGIRVGKHTKTWVVIRGRSRDRTVIGRYPDLSLSEARLTAKKQLLAAPEQFLSRKRKNNSLNRTTATVPRARSMK